MPQTYINFTGHLFQDDGDAVSGATVQLLETGTTTVEASTTTNSDGKWTFAEADQDEYDVKITSGTSVRYIRWDDEISVQELDVRNNASATTPAATFSNVTNSASNQVAIFRSANSTRADGDEIYVSFELADDGGNLHEFARMTAEATDVSNGSEDGQFRFGVSVAGTITDVFTINSTTGGAAEISYEIDSFTIKGGEGEAGVLYLMADQGDDAGDEWKINVADGGVLTFGNDIASAGSYVTHMTITPHATTASSSVAIVGDATVGDDLSLTSDSSVFNMGAGNDFTITHDGTTGATIAGNPLTLDSGADIVLDAEGGDIFFKDGGTTFGSATNTSGNLIIKSGTTTALTFSGANVTIAGDLTISGDDLTMGTNTSTAILVADGTNYNPVVPSGVIDLANDGSFTLDNTVISSQTEITSGLAAADELLYSDGGTVKKIGLDNFVELAPTLATEDAIANGDYILFLDGGASGNMNKEAVHDLATLFAGSGLTATNSVIAVDTLNQDTSGTAAVATTVTITDNESTDEDNAIVFTAGGDVDGGNLGLESDGTLTYNPSTGKITATGFLGAIDGILGANSAAAITGTTIDATTDFTIGSTVITDDSIVMTPSTSDTVTIAGATHGILNITTVDAAGTAADVNIDADGEIVIDAADAAGSIFKIAGTAQLSIIDGSILPTTDNDIDLGSSSYQFKDAYINGTLEADAITIGGTNVVTGSLVTTLGTISAGVWQGTAIASSYIAADAITGAKIADNAIDSEHYTDGSIDNAHIADDAIDSEHYTDGSIDNAHIADDAIDSEHYAAGSIDTAHIADNQITLAKMAGLARGKLIYGDASGDPAALAVGSADQVLTHDGTDLAWADAAGGGGGGTASFTADGSIAAGEAVGLTAAGKVTSITGMGPQYKTDDMPVADFYDANGSMQGDLVWCGSTGKVAFVGFWGSLSSYGYVTIGEYSTTTKAITWGTPVIFHSGNISLSVQAVWDENVDRLVILYPNSSDDAGTSLVYQISATGNTVVVSDGGGEYAPGTAQTFEAGATKNITADFDSNANKIIIFYEDDADSDYGKAVIGTVTGGSTNTMANTTAEKYNGNNASFGNCVKWDYDNGKGLLAFMDGGDSNYTKCVAFTHDGTNYTFGTIIEPFGANQLVHIADGHRVSNSVSFDSSNDNFVIVGGWADGDGDDVMRAVAVSVSGTTCTAGTAVVVTDKPQGDDGTQDVVPLEDGAAIEYDPDRDVHVLLVPEFSKNLPDLTRGDDGRMGDNSYVYGAYPLTLSGTGDRTTNVGTRFSASGAMWLSIAPWSSGSAQYRNLAYDTTNNVMHFITTVDGISTGGEATTMKPAITTFHGSTNALAYAQSTMDKFIGFNTSAVSDGASATITVKGGINENQSSLTVGQHYYISDDGKLTTTKPWASQFLYRAGIATAATKLIVLNDWYGG